MKYLVIADEETVLGFRCAGIPGVVAAGGGDALAALKSARAQEVGIVILTEEVADTVRDEVNELRIEEELPIVVEIPGPQGPLAGRRSLTEIVRATVGVKV